MMAGRLLQPMLTATFICFDDGTWDSRQFNGQRAWYK
jgi:hypothetical protein